MHELISPKEAKKSIKGIIKEANEQQLRSDSERYKKLNWESEKYEKKEYIDNMNVEQIRLMFRYRTQMFEGAKFNFKNTKEYQESLWLCDSCETAISTNTHVLWCEAYHDLREGLNLESDLHLVEYLSKVMKIRDQLKLRR